jgi:hypothetical protein
VVRLAAKTKIIFSTPGISFLFFGVCGYNGLRARFSPHFKALSCHQLGRSAIRRLGRQKGDKRITLARVCCKMPNMASEAQPQTSATTNEHEWTAIRTGTDVSRQLVFIGVHSWFKT